MDAPIRVMRRTGCDVDGCDRPHLAKGKCHTHYNRLTNGIPMDAPVRGHNLPIGHVSKLKSGYCRIKVATDKGASKWKDQHVHVMEQHLGRSILPSEVVHHKNRRRADNRLENLQVRNRDEHPPGGSVSHLIAWCIEFLSRYGKVSFKPNAHTKQLNIIPQDPLENLK